MNPQKLLSVGGWRSDGLLSLVMTTVGRVDRIFTAMSEPTSVSSHLDDTLHVRARTYRGVV